MFILVENISIFQHYTCDEELIYSFLDKKL